MTNLSLTALGGDDGAVICKVTVTYYVTYYGSSGPAHSGLTDIFLIADVVQNNSSLKNKTKKPPDCYTKNLLRCKSTSGVDG